MPLTFNENTPGAIRFNTQRVSTVRRNNTVVWQAGGLVPVGGVLLRLLDTGYTVPDGYATVTQPTGFRNLRGIGSTVSAGNGGSTQTSFNVSLNSAGLHSGAPTFTAIGQMVTSGTTFRQDATNNVSNPSGTHTHTVSGGRTTAVGQLSTTMIVKTGTPGPIPVGFGCLSAVPLSGANVELVTGRAGRFITRDTNNNNFITLGTPYASLPVDDFTIASSSDGLHAHGNNIRQYIDYGTVTWPYPAYEGGAAGLHSHNVTIRTLAENILPLVIKLGLYRMTEEGLVLPGSIIPYVGDLGDLTNGWYHANGTNGTVDVRDRYPEITDLEVEMGTHAGNGTVTMQVISVSMAGAHTHATDYNPNHNPEHTRTSGHSSTEPDHTHTFSGNIVVPFNPTYYGIHFIQYLG